MGNKVYTEDSIQSLTPLEFTRLRPGVYCGSTEYSTQLLIEIVSNAIDEFKAGHGDTIKVDITKDNVITVEDNGQGFIPNARKCVFTFYGKRCIPVFQTNQGKE